jgi:transcription elongation GreA/GreB family factor
VIDKKALFTRTLETLRTRHAALLKAAGDARASATDGENKSEGKYDTRGLEASYLAAGQADQALELGAAISSLESMKLTGFAPGDPVDLGALVAVKSGGFTDRYFIVPAGGGIEIDGVTTLTPGTPLGKLLQGRSVGDTFQVRPGAPEATVESVA